MTLFLNPPEFSFGIPVQKVMDEWVGKYSGKWEKSSHNIVAWRGMGPKG